MQLSSSKEAGRKKPINLTIRKDVLEAAKSLNLNASKAAEAGIIEAIRQAEEQAWLNENSDAIQAHNRRIDSHDTLLKPQWQD